MKKQYTSGPWSVDAYLGVVACGRIIALTGVDTGLHRDANARLIAAAPDLLEALKEMLDNHEDACTGYGEGAAEKARAAIAKAEDE